MIAVKEICALLIAGGLGAGGTLAVQQVKKPAAVRKASKPAQYSPVRHAPASAAPRAMNDCPAQVAGLAEPMQLAPIPPMDVAPGLDISRTPLSMATGHGPGTSLPGDIGTGGQNGGVTPIIIPGVPEPYSWAMLVTGFGLIGLAMRRTSPLKAAKDV